MNDLSTPHAILAGVLVAIAVIGMLIVKFLFDKWKL